MKTESGKDKMFTLVGKGVSPGLAKGKAFIYRDVLQRDSELYVIDRAQIGEEKARIEKAITDVRQGLNIDAKRIEGKLGKHSANIFLAQEAILLDSFVVEEMKRILESELINAEQVVRTVFRLLARRFRDMNNEVLRERGDDIDDLLSISLTTIRLSYGSSSWWSRNPVTLPCLYVGRLRAGSMLSPGCLEPGSGLSVWPLHWFRTLRIP